jgi:hypothetical protein
MLLPSRRLEPNEQVVVFPTTGWRDDPSAPWRVRFRGWVFEPEPRSRWRANTPKRVAMILSRWLGPHADAELATQLFRWFLVNHEGGKQIDFQIGPHRIASPNCLSDGRFSCELELAPSLPSGVHALALADEENANQLAAPAALTLAESEGLSIICDIDDTLKKSEVFSRRLLLHNTFYKPWEPVEGMAKWLASWSSAGATIHYVSAMPWPLFLAFSAFCRQHDFPVGSVDMRDFRLRDRSIFRFFGSSLPYKRAKVVTLLQHFPRRKFVLVGDSGENDPEIYGEVARQFPEQVVAIWIRNLEDKPRSDPRWSAAFGGLSPDLWHLFSNGEDLPTTREGMFAKVG